MFNPESLMKDEFQCSYNDEKEFFDAVKAFDQEAEWKRVPIASLSFIPQKKMDAEKVVGGALAMDGSSSMAIAISEPDGRVFCLRPWANASLHALCQDEAKIYKKFEAKGRYDEIAARLNQDLSVLPEDKEFEFLFRGQKVSGAFGDFNHEWTQSDQLRALKGKLNDMFGRHSFISGIVSHVETRAVYQLGMSICDAGVIQGDEGTAAEAVLAPYRDAWIRAGKDAASFDEAIPYLEFCTGESGLAQIALVPKFSYRYGSTRIDALLGGPMKVNHRGSEAAVWGKFMELLSGVAAQYQNGLREVARLADLQIMNPYSCLTHCLKPFCSSVPLSEITMEADTFALFYPPTEEAGCSALVIYETINTLIGRVAERVSATKRLNNMELAARMLSPGFSWSSKDVARPATLSSRKT